MVTAGVAGGLAIGASANSAIGFPGGGLLSGLGANIGKTYHLIFSNIVTSDNNTSPNRNTIFW